jgi:hypothetical protein
MLYSLHMPRLSAEPVYRHVLRDAFRLAWEEKWLWPISILAGVLLTGSVYDIMGRVVGMIAIPTGPNGDIQYFWMKASSGWSGLSLSDTIFAGISVLEFVALFFLIIFAVFAISVIAQGALTYALGSRKRMDHLKEAITVGARAFWPLLVLNLFAVAALWASRTFVGVILSWSLLHTSALSYLLYLFTFIVFVAFSAVIIMIQVFALNAMMLQGATLAQAIERAAKLVKNHWLVATETATALFVVSLGAWIIAVAVNMVLGIPLFVLIIVALLLQSKLLMWTVLFLAIVIFCITMLGIGAFLVQFHYATWTLLFRRLGEGGVAPKLHRWIRTLTHGTNVPGA